MQFLNTLQKYFCSNKPYRNVLSKWTIINHFSFSPDRCHHGLCQPQSVCAQDDVSRGPSARVPLGHDPFPLHFPNSKYMEVVPWLNHPKVSHNYNPVCWTFGRLSVSDNQPLSNNKIKKNCIFSLYFSFVPRPLVVQSKTP